MGAIAISKAPRELCDLDHDPHERDNIAGQRPPAQQALRGALDRLVAGAPLGSPGAISAEDRKRLMALGYVGTQAEIASTAAADLPDPKDKREILERYRASVDLAAQRKWGLAMSLLQQILVEDPGMGDIWGQLAVYAVREERYAEALDAYKHAIELRPSDPTNYIGAAAVLLVLGKVDEAREHATLALRVAGDGETRERVEACEQLARIGLAKHDAAAARRAAELAQQADPTLPMPAYITARLLYDQGQVMRRRAPVVPASGPPACGIRDLRRCWSCVSIRPTPWPAWTERLKPNRNSSRSSIIFRRMRGLARTWPSSIRAPAARTPAFGARRHAADHSDACLLRSRRARMDHVWQPAGGRSGASPSATDV